jgi:hypothetical protein
MDRTVFGDVMNNKKRFLLSVAHAGLQETFIKYSHGWLSGLFICAAVIPFDQRF